MRSSIHLSWKFIAFHIKKNLRGTIISRVKPNTARRKLTWKLSKNLDWGNLVVQFGSCVERQTWYQVEKLRHFSSFPHRKSEFLLRFPFDFSNSKYERTSRNWWKQTEGTKNIQFFVDSWRIKTRLRRLNEFFWFSWYFVSEISKKSSKCENFRKIG